MCQAAWKTKSYVVKKMSTAGKWQRQELIHSRTHFAGSFTVAVPAGDQAPTPLY